MDWVARIILGVLLILAGLGWSGYRLLDAFAGDPNEGPLGGWALLLAGIFVAILGLIVVVF